MKQRFRNLMALSLLVAYSLSISISIQNYIVDTVLDTKQHPDVAFNLSDSKTPVLSIFPDLEPLGEIAAESPFNFQTEKLKSHFQLYKYVERYTLTKDNQYLYISKNIQPGLDLDALLYPFHTFS